MSAASSAFQLPTEPYPGLRPFLDHEAALLQGRGSQVREVIERLEQTKFVAIVGGSGCGKSSLIRAGVVPKLRAAAIQEAGGYWVPVVCTPGTTAADGDAAPAQTPLTRLAWKFSQMLEAVDDSSARCDEIVSVFRRGSGFARLVDTYAQDLPDQGAEHADARFLFVIDQFEELFHRNNHGNPDARLLIEAVISHFFNPHPRCFIVLTMRSERLADCAAYLNLPDAINRSMYLVRRLSESELRDAIIGPAKYYLRLCQRAGTPAPLPPDANFDEDVIARLLEDVSLIVDDPDHLPLLQHVLARTWDAARRREGCPPRGVPAAVTWADLEIGALPPGLDAHARLPPPRLAPGPGGAERDGINTLRASLDHWAQLKYEQRTPGEPRSPEERAQIDALLPRLGYRDPNNGLYFQQRLELDTPGLFPPGSNARAHLIEVLQRGFLDEVHYLFWDRENPERETLKVSHESFIRGWEHFRKLVDIEADRFEEFMALLRRCAAWAPQRRPQLLLESSELVRLQAARLDDVLNVEQERHDWFRVLLQARDGRRLAAMHDQVDDFVAESRALQRAEEEAQRATQARAARNRTALLLVGGVAVCAGVVAWVQSPALASLESFARARIMSERIDVRPGDSATLPNLVDLLQAAALVQKGRQEAQGLYPWIRNLDAVPVFGPAGRLPDIGTSEAAVNGRLRYLLTHSMWRSQMTAGLLDRVDPKLRYEPRVEAANCRLPSGPRHGRLYIDAGQVRPGPRRAIFVPEPQGSDKGYTDIVLHSVAYEDDKPCAAGPDFWSVPASYEPRLLLDARVRYLAASTAYKDPAAAGPGRRSVTLYEVEWSAGRDDAPTGAKLRPLTVVTSDTAAATFGAEFGRPDPAFGALAGSVRAVKTWREPAGYGFLAGNQAWRVIDDNAQAMPDGGQGSSWETLRAENLESPCRWLADQLRVQLEPGFKSAVYGFRGQCIEVKHGEPPNPAGPSQREQVLVALYDTPNIAALQRLGQQLLPSAIASIKAFERRRVGANMGPDQWVIATDGPYRGWIGTKRRNASGQEVLAAAPLTTEALHRLGASLCRLARHAGAADSPPTHPTARGAGDPCKED